MLQHLQAELEDPILKVMASYKASTTANKQDLGIGVYRDGLGNTPIYAAVKAAELHLQQQERSKAYLGPIGDTAYTQALTQLLLNDSVPDDLLRCIQTPGGTGALRIAGELLHRALPNTTLWLSDPAWSTHDPIFTGAGLKLSRYRYFDTSTRTLNFSAMLADIKNIPPGDAVLLQSCGHNPSGCNLTDSQWFQVAELLAERQLLPVLDLAYHGLDQGLELDLISIRAIESCHKEWLLCYSASKTFSLYNDRTGALFLRSETAKAAQQLLNLTLNLVCANYYMPPAHGASVIRTILTSDELCHLWKSELETARQRVIQCRQTLVDSLKTTATADFNYLTQQQGLFAYLGLTETQLNKLQREHGLFLGPGGRLNIAGVNDTNLQLICKALCQL